jgi:hypothetical protein
MRKTRRIPLTNSATEAPRFVQDLSYDIIRVVDLSAAAYRQLKYLTLGEAGLMQVDLMSTRKLSKVDPAYAQMAVVIVAQHPKDGIIGWALLYNDVELRVRTSRNKARTERVWKRGNGPRWTSHFYVKKRFRGLGLGTELFSRMKLIRKRFHQFKHSTESNAFFKKNR